MKCSKFTFDSTRLASCGGRLKAYAHIGSIGPPSFLFSANFTALTTSKRTDPALGASTVENFRSICIGALQK